jgi:hypothetical protein
MIHATRHFSKTRISRTIVTIGRMAFGAGLQWVTSPPYGTARDLHMLKSLAIEKIGVP